MGEVTVGGQKNDVVSDAQLCEQCIDRAHLHACSSASVTQVRRRDVVFAIRLQQGQRSKALDDLCARFGA